MLNLTFVMNGLYLALMHFILVAALQSASELQPEPTATPIIRAEPAENLVNISSPSPGEALQGVISITGNTSLEGFQSYEVEFAYAGDPTGTWFPILTSLVAASDGLLAQWDTSTITDGYYDLRLTVRGSGNEAQSFIVSGVRVRNYTPIETQTPGPQTILEEAATPTTRPTQVSTASDGAAQPSPLPTNPAQVTAAELGRSLAAGALGVLAAFLVGGLYIVIRGIGKKA